jgi:ribonuclease G
LPEWLVEQGIGEMRAALIDDNVIIEARIERSGAQPLVGRIYQATIVREVIAGRAAIGRFATPPMLEGPTGELLIEPLPPRITKHPFDVRVVREGYWDGTKLKRPKARPVDPLAPQKSGPDDGSLSERLARSPHPRRDVTPHGPDLLEEAGWSEVMAQAQTGDVRFDGGSLHLFAAPAMTLIDIDGWLDPEALALAAAPVVGQAIRRFDLCGSVGIDFPTVKSRAVRHRLGAMVAISLNPLFQQTNVNGFGFMQVVSPRFRPSLVELFRTWPVERAVCATLRRAQRSGLVGATTLVVNQAVGNFLSAPGAPALPPRAAGDHGWAGDHVWLDQLARHLGGPVSLRIDPALGMEAGYATRTI